MRQAPCGARGREPGAPIWNRPDCETEQDASTGEQTLAYNQRIGVRSNITASVSNILSHPISALPDDPHGARMTRMRRADDLPGDDMDWFETDHGVFRNDLRADKGAPFRCRRQEADLPLLTGARSVSGSLNS